MRTAIIILVSILVIVTILLVTLFGSLAISEGSDEGNKLNRYTASYKYRDKAPMGCYAAYKIVESIFEDVKPAAITSSFARTYRNNKSMKLTDGAYIIVAGKLYTTSDDVEAMYNYVSAGNILYIAAEWTDSLFNAKFGFSIYDTLHLSGLNTTVNKQFFEDKAFAPDTAFEGKGLSMHNSFENLHQSLAGRTVLGRNAGGDPNFVRIKVGEGYLYLILNPMTWTNYFLMQHDHVKALENQMAYLPEYPDRIFWDEYYKTLRWRPQSDFSNWQVLMKHPALRWALWLAVILLLIYVIFEGKRRQRLIPQQPVLSNASLEFVSAVGRLYFQHHNNSNLAQKMTQHLLEYIRTRYYLNTSRLNDEFVTALSRKSGQPHDEVTALVAQIKYLREAGDVDDHQLQHYYNSIHQFYLKAS